MREDDVYGERRDRHQRIMMMTAAELHAAHPWTEGLAFNEVMVKKQFDEGLIPDDSVIQGTKADGKPHRWCVGNQEGEILPKFLMVRNPEMPLLPFADPAIPTACGTLQWHQCFHTLSAG